MKRGSTLAVSIVCFIILALSSWVHAQTAQQGPTGPGVKGTGVTDPKAPPVKDETWKIYLESGVKKYYFSPATVQKLDKRKVRVWEKIADRTTDGEVDKIKSLIEFDCSTSKYRIVASKEFDPTTGTDKPEIISENDPWQYFSLESILGVLYDNVCYQGGVKIPDTSKPVKPKKEEKKK